MRSMQGSAGGAAGQEFGTTLVAAMKSLFVSFDSPMKLDGSTGPALVTLVGAPGLTSAVIVTVTVWPASKPVAGLVQSIVIGLSPLGAQVKPSDAIALTLFRPVEITLRTTTGLPTSRPAVAVPLLRTRFVYVRTPPWATGSGMSVTSMSCRSTPAPLTEVVTQPWSLVVFASAGADVEEAQLWNGPVALSGTCAVSVMAVLAPAPSASPAAVCVQVTTAATLVQVNPFVPIADTKV